MVSTSSTPASRAAAPLSQTKLCSPSTHASGTSATAALHAALQLQPPVQARSSEQEVARAPAIVAKSLPQPSSAAASACSAPLVGLASHALP